MDIGNNRVLDGEKPEDLKSEESEDDFNVDVLREELKEVDNGLIVMKWQTGTGKTYSVLEVGAEYVKNEDTVLMLVPGQKLAVEIEDDLIEEHNLDEDEINRIKGFERASDLYPAEEDENGGKNALPKDEWTETQRKVYEDRKMGQKPLNIVQKYCEEDEEDEWKDQFEEFEGKFVIAPIEYLKVGKLSDIREEAEWIVNDEDIDDEDEIGWSVNRDDIEELSAELFDNHEEVLEEMIAEVRQEDQNPESDIGFDLGLDSLGTDKLHKMVFGDEDEPGFLGWIETLDKQMKNYSAAFSLGIDEIDERIETENRKEEIVRTVGDFRLVFENPIYDNIDQVKFIEYVLNKARKKIYLKENEPENYRMLFEDLPSLNLVSKFGRIVEYERLKCRERVVEWGENKRKSKDFEENKEVKKEEESFEAGFIKEDGDLKPYRKEGDCLTVFEKVFEVQGGERVEKPYFVYQKPVAFTLFTEMQDKPVILTDASFKPEYLDIIVDDFARYRSRLFDVNSVEGWHWSWESLVEKGMNEIDYWAFHNIKGATPYFPIGEGIKGKDVNVAEVPKADIELRMTSTDVRGKGSTVTRLSKPLANKSNMGRFSKSAQDDLKGDLRNGDLSVMLRMAERSDKEYSVISFKEVVEAIRQEFDYFDENNTEYYHNLRGTNNLKNKNLIVIGTGMVNLNEFREWAIYRGFDREEVMNPTKKGERYVYEENPELQAMYEKHTSEIMYQAIQRARGMDEKHEIDVFVLGIVPEKIKEEFEYQKRNLNHFIEKAVIEENGGKEKMVERALEEGLTIGDIRIDENVSKARYLDVLIRIREAHEDLALKAGESWYDREVGMHEQKKSKKEKYSKLVEVIKENPEEVDGRSTTELKEFLNSVTGIGTGFMDKEFFERLRKDGIGERTKKGFGEPKKFRLLDTEQVLE